MEGDGDNPLPATRRGSISIHALRVEGDPVEKAGLGQHHISIHALRVEGDVFGIYPHLSNFISIHALRVEGDTR